MPDFSSATYNQIDGSNVQPAPDGFPEGILANRVGGAVRALIGAGKRFYDRINPTVTSTGAANAYSLTYAMNPAALTKGETFAFFAHQANTGAATFNIAGFAPRALVTAAGAPLPAGAIVAGAVHSVVYDGSVYRLQQFSTANVELSGATKLAGTLEVVGATTLSTVAATSATVSGALAAGSATVGGSRVLTLADVGATKGLDADLLDGQHGAFYQSASNLTAGTLPAARLSGAYSITSLTVTGGITGTTTLDLRAGATVGLSIASNGTVTVAGTSNDTIQNIRQRAINAQAAADAKVALTGGTLSGPLTLTYANPAYHLHNPGQRIWYLQALGQNLRIVDQSGNYEHTTMHPNGNVTWNAVPNHGAVILSNLVHWALRGDDQRYNGLRGIRQVDAGHVGVPGPGLDFHWAYAPYGSFFRGVRKSNTAAPDAFHAYYLQGYSDARNWYTID